MLSPPEPDHTISSRVRIEILEGKNLFPVNKTQGEAYFQIGIKKQKKKFVISRLTTNIIFSPDLNRFEMTEVNHEGTQIPIIFCNSPKKKETQLYLTYVNVSDLLPFNTRIIKTYQMFPVDQKGVLKEPAPKTFIYEENAHAKRRPLIILSMYLFQDRDDKKDKDLLKESDALIQAVLQGDLFLVLSLLEMQKINVNYQDQQGNTALHLASSQYSNKHIILSLLENAEVDIKICNHDNNTPFHHYCANYRNPDCREAFELFMKRDARIDASNKNGETPIHKAFSNKSNKKMMMEILIEYGVDAISNMNQYCIILAGGSGVRLCPQSRESTHNTSTIF